MEKDSPSRKVIRGYSGRYTSRPKLQCGRDYRLGRRLLLGAVFVIENTLPVVQTLLQPLLLHASSVNACFRSTVPGACSASLLRSAASFPVTGLARARAVPKPLLNRAVLIALTGLPVTPAGLHSLSPSSAILIAAAELSETRRTLHPLLRHGTVWIAKAELAGGHPTLYSLLGTAPLSAKAALSVSEAVLRHSLLLEHCSVSITIAILAISCAPLTCLPAASPLTAATSGKCLSTRETQYGRQSQTKSK